MVKRVAIGCLLGGVAAVLLECINGFLAFMLPPLIFITPLCISLALVISIREPKRHTRD